MIHRLIGLLIVLMLIACDTPTPDPTREATAAPDSTSSSSTTAIAETPISIDGGKIASGILRDAVNDTDRRNAEEVARADLPIGDLRELGVRLAGLPADTPEVDCSSAPEYNVGDETTFEVSNSDTFEQFTVTATLLAREPNVYIWVDNDWLSLVDSSAAEQAAREFDEKILPRNRELFGMEWSPGIDCDPRLHVLNTSNTGAGGYFSSVDQYTTVVRSDSNEKEMFYIDIENMGGPLALGDNLYLGVLAHEYQHMIHFHIDRNEDTWANEGLSELASYLNGYSVGGSDFAFSSSPDTQLNFWPSDNTFPHYGASFTFWLYFYDKFGEEGISRIVASEHNGLEGVSAALQAEGYRGTLDDFFADWVVAKVLDDPSIEDGRYGFTRSDPPQASITEDYSSYPQQFDRPQSVSQYAADYYQFLGDKDLRIEFAGQTKAQLIDAEPHSGTSYWWSNRGDSANMRLTREVDLRNVSSATLNYWTWFDIEEDWDYAYVTVSDDGGATWDILRTPSGTDRDPNNNSFGWGYTGQSGNGFGAEWIEESVDLTPYAGKNILLRFETVHDLAVNMPGFAIDDIRIPEIDFSDDTESDSGWTAEGWVRTNNFVPQTFIAQLIAYNNDGSVRVTRLPINEDNSATWDIPLSQMNSAVIVLSATAVKTSEPAFYNWKIEEATD